MIRYVYSTEGIQKEHLQGFFVGWSAAPSPQTHLNVLNGSDEIVLAVEKATGRVAGFITALTDGVLAAYIPLLEVLPEFQGQGIGEELVRRMLERLNGLYAIDLLCDPDVQPFYRRFGMSPAQGMLLRNRNAFQEG